MLELSQRVDEAIRLVSRDELSDCDKNCVFQFREMPVERESSNNPAVTKTVKDLARWLFAFNYKLIEELRVEAQPLSRKL